MVKNRLLLGSVAFGMSFGLSLLVNRHIKTAFVTGLITVPATFSGIVAVNRKQLTKQKLPLTSLQTQIHQLKRRKTQLIQSLSATTTEKQRTEANLNFLKTELSQLYTQIAEQRSYKQQLSQDLVILREDRGQLEAESHELQTQIHTLKQRKGELYQFLQSIRTQKQNTEASFNFLPAKIKQLQVQIAERQNQQEALERDLALLKIQKKQLEEQSHNLQTQIQGLENSKAKLTQSLSAIAATKQITETSVNSLQAELIQLQSQIAQQQQNKEELKQEFITIQEKIRQLKIDEKPIDNLPEEWNEFVMRLPKYELQVLKALVDKSNTVAKIKKVAEENITMPEILIDLVNKRALNTIGDLIIKPGVGSIPPEITEEYLTNVKKVIKIKEMN